jgi:putative transposase
LIRRVLTDAQWRRIEPLISGKEGDEGATVRTIDCSWTLCFGWFVPEHHGAICPKEFGNWNSVLQRFRRWTKKGIWKSLFNALVEDPDFEYLIIHPTIVRAHQHAAGLKKGGAKMRRSGVRAAA